MCRNQYANAICGTCRPKKPIRYHTGVIYCSQSDGSRMCYATLREMHRGPTTQIVCTKCHNIIAPPPLNNNQSNYQEVIPGYSQLETDITIGAWRDDQQNFADLRQQYVDTGIADAQRNGEQVLQQSFDVAMAEATAFPPPEGMQYQYNDQNYQQAADQATYTSGQTYTSTDYNGEASGYNQGYDQGYSQDFSQGYNQGYDQGHNSGHGQ